MYSRVLSLVLVLTLLAQNIGCDAEKRTKRRDRDHKKREGSEHTEQYRIILNVL